MADRSIDEFETDFLRKEPLEYSKRISEAITQQEAVEAAEQAIPIGDAPVNQVFLIRSQLDELNRILELAENPDTLLKELETEFNEQSQKVTEAKKKIELKFEETAFERDFFGEPQEGDEPLNFDFLGEPIQNQGRQKDIWFDFSRFQKLLDETNVNSGTDADHFQYGRLLDEAIAHLSSADAATVRAVGLRERQFETFSRLLSFACEDQVHSDEVRNGGYEQQLLQAISDYKASKLHLEGLRLAHQARKVLHENYSTEEQVQKEIDAKGHLANLSSLPFTSFKDEEEIKYNLKGFSVDESIPKSGSKATLVGSFAAYIETHASTKQWLARLADFHEADAALKRAEERVDRLGAIVKWRHEEMIGRYRRLSNSRNDFLREFDFYLSEASLGNYERQIVEVQKRATRDFVYGRYLLAKAISGLIVVLDFSTGWGDIFRVLDERQDNYHRIGEFLTFALRLAKEISAIEEEDTKWVYRISLVESVGGQKKFRSMLASGQFKFTLNLEDVDPEICLPRLVGVNAYYREIAEYSGIGEQIGTIDSTFTAPTTGHTRYDRDEKIDTIQQHHRYLRSKNSPIGKKEPRRFRIGRISQWLPEISPDIAGGDVCANISPFGDWEISVRSFKKSVILEDVIGDIWIDFHIIHQNVWRNVRQVSPFEKYRR